MNDALVLYTNPTSRGRIARWMLEEIGRSYSVELLDYGTGMKSATYLAINPMGKVPALRHGETVVTETAAICAYLADAFPDAGLAPPPGDRLRGPYYRWLFFGAGPLEAAIIDKAMGLVLSARQGATAGYGSLDRVLDTIERAVAPEGYLAGGRFTTADLYVASQIELGLMFRMIEDRPVLSAYATRIGDRPARLRARAIDDALSAGRTPG